MPGDTNNNLDVFVHDRVTGSTERVSVASDGSQANGGSNVPAISADGRYVAFGSGAGNLAPGDTNVSGDVFVHDRVTGGTERVSVASDGGGQANGGSMSPRSVPTAATSHSDRCGQSGAGRHQRSVRRIRA